MCDSSHKQSHNRQYLSAHEMRTVLERLGMQFVGGDDRKSPCLVPPKQESKKSGKCILADCVHVQAVRRFYNQKYGKKEKAESAMSPEVAAFVEKWIAENSPPLTPEQLKNLEQLSDSENWTPESFDHVIGEFCFILVSRQPLAEPIPAKGKLNLWTFSLPTN